MILIAIAGVAFAPPLLSDPRICPFTVPLMVCAFSGPITHRAIARAVGFVVPVGSVFDVIVVPLRVKEPRSVTGLI
jgi:hypothetical protein